MRRTLAIMFLLITNNFIAQVKFGPIVGLNLATQSIDQWEFIDDKFAASRVLKPGIIFGVETTVPLFKRVELATGLRFSQKGILFHDKPLYYKEINNYLVLPVSLKLYVVKDIISLSLGGYSGYWINGKLKWKLGVVEEGEEIEKGQMDRDFINTSTEKDIRFDYGINGEIGFQFNKYHSEINVSYFMGFSDIYFTEENDIFPNFKTYNYNLAFSYIYWLKHK